MMLHGAFKLQRRTTFGIMNPEKCSKGGFNKSLEEMPPLTCSLLHRSRRKVYPGLEDGRIELKTFFNAMASDSLKAALGQITQVKYFLDHSFSIVKKSLMSRFFY